MAASLYIKGSNSEGSNEIFRYAACVEKLFTGGFSGLGYQVNRKSGCSTVRRPVEIPGIRIPGVQNIRESVGIRNSGGASRHPTKLCSK